MSRRVEVRHAGTAYLAEILGNGEVRIDGQVLRVEALSDGRCLVTREDGTHTVVAHAGPSVAPWLFAAGQPWQADVVRRRAMTDLWVGSLRAGSDSCTNAALRCRGRRHDQSHRGGIF